MLPYWDWTTNRAMPAPFTDSTPGNPLYTTHRGPGINTGALLPTSAVAYAGDMTDIPFASFSPDLEGTPHGAVHVACGGWMGQIPTAGQDPIFWLHHCNIDRLWDAWIRAGGGRADPTGAWLSQTFSYFDETGTEVSVPMSRSVDPCASLGYSYVSRFVIRPWPWPLINLLLEEYAAQIRAAPDAPSAQAELGDAPARLVLPLRAPPTAVAPRYFLVFDEIAVGNPEGYYEIYFDAPEGRPLDPQGPNYAGNLVLFGLTKRELAVKHGDMQMPPPRRVFDITRKLRQLSQGGASAPQTLTITLALRTTEGAKPEPGIRAHVGRVQLIAG
jgi:tyrosinase